MKLAALNEEKKYGSREIDLIEQDIRAVNSEISSLQWKKWF